ncbi:MAG TPA: MFS transporter [Chroococcales cyanobacterium]
MAVKNPADSPAWEPFRYPIFRALWLASLASHVGSWMQDVGAAWLMTTLAPSPLMVALVQAAGDLPVLLLALPAGALADLLDRRRLLLFTQSWMMLGAAVLGGLTLIGWINPWILLAFTFAISAGEALNNPAWQAIASDLVPRPQLRQAITLNGAGYNLARAVGPALAGMSVAAIGSGCAFLLNAASFLAVVFVLFRWRRTAPPSVAPAERVVGAMGAGLRYIRNSSELLAILMRVASFVLGGSALWALLPLFVRQELGQTSLGYGILLGAFGVGAVTATWGLPSLRGHLPINRMVAASTALFAGAILCLSFLRQPLVLFLVMFAGGGAWMALLSSFMGAVQTATPLWVRGRALSIYLLIFQGGMASGSIFWGFVAEVTGIPNAFKLAALALLLGLLTLIRYRLPLCEMDFTPYPHWPAPGTLSDSDLERGPILVSVEYRIEPARKEEFAEAMEALKQLRRRDGAIRWELFSDANDPRRQLEFFLVESWAEHLRQHERFTQADRLIEERARSFHVGKDPPQVSHLLFEAG